MKQPIARKANLEDACKGHFFEQRFYSGALRDENSILAAMTYVDLNPVRAKLCKRIENCAHTSIRLRLRRLANSKERLANYLAPVAAGISCAPREKKSLFLAHGAYVNYLRQLTDTDEQNAERQHKWQQKIASLSRKHRVYGNNELLDAWCTSRGWSRSHAILS